MIGHVQYPFDASLLSGRPDKSIIFVRFSASEYIDSLDTFYKVVHTTSSQCS